MDKQRADNRRYSVILTGELQPGFDTAGVVPGLAHIFDAPAAELYHLFDGGAHVVEGDFAATEALDLQARIERIGARARVERLPPRRVALKLSTDAPGAAADAADAAVAEAARMRCPACDYEQPVAETCESCGVSFAHYLAAQRAKLQGEASPVHGPNNVAPHMQDDWDRVWDDFEDQFEPDENAHLSLFFGPDGAHYSRECPRYMDGPKMRFALGWNWGAVFSPFLWAVYRRMWGWGVLIFLVEVLFPVLAIILGNQVGVSNKLAYVGWLAVLGNRLFWPVVADFLYCRHARATIGRLHRLAPTYAAEIDIVAAGGVSSSSVILGLAISGVLSLFLWSVMDSIKEDRMTQFEQRLYEGAAQTIDREVPTDPLTGVAANPAVDSENKWVGTRRKLRQLGQSINTWMARHAAVTDATQLSLFQLREELGIEAVDLRDSWNTEVQYIPDTEGYRLISAGPDLLFGTADDIQYRRTMGE